MCLFIYFLACLSCRPDPQPSPHGHVIACRITAENPDEVSSVILSYTEITRVILNLPSVILNYCDIELHVNLPKMC